LRDIEEQFFGDGLGLFDGLVAEGRLSGQLFDDRR
jgi:hypothetical protein